MAQLSDDCFAFGGPLLPLADALAMLRERVPAVADVERLPLAACQGRVLRAPLIASLAVPAYDNAAVDGYAVRFEDLDPKAETRLPLGGRAAAGHPLGRAIEPGEAIRIFTGAPLPEGADTVMMQEDCSLHEGIVAIRPGIGQGANCRAAGEDVAEGSKLLPAGRRLRPWDLGLAASQGLSELPVARLLRVALCSTGDELAEPGAARHPGQIYDCNRRMVAALLRGEGCQVTDLGILADRRSLIRTVLADAAKRHDLLLTTGGVSGGEEDHVKAALSVAGGALHFWRLAIKPGRPLALGTLGKAAFAGLPGNPVACAVTFAALVRPLLQRMSGAVASDLSTFPVVSGFDYAKKRERQEWLRVSLEARGTALPRAHRFPRDGAGILSSLAGSDGFLILEEHLTQVPRGSTLPFLPFSEVLA
ncbi:MAG: molybdopterin molybdotransferase MoeA [Rhodospirillales bacterium]|nr:molybdopterin molybdotransferase MoeA [Rhodospirillales bacterium]